MKKPCDNCPWRRDAPREYWDPEHFVEIWRNCQDDGTHVMLCHKASRLREEQARTLVCRGWVQVLGFDAIGVRLAVMSGRISADDVPAEGDAELYASFEEMMDANGVEQPSRNAMLPPERANGDS
jgi:hypothetical protein